MESKLFSIGDIVSLKIHPYYREITNIIVSGDHVMIPPLMIVLEVFNTKQNIFGGMGSFQTYKYKCIWFSSKSYRFIDTLISEADLKLIAETISNICKPNLKRGDKVTLKSVPYELNKKKSSLTYEENSVALSSGNTIINSLLSFLSPVMQVLDIKAHSTKNPLIDKKTSKAIRQVHAWDVKCALFDPLSDKISEIILPLEALELIYEVDQCTLELLHRTILESGYLFVGSGKEKSVVKPTNIAFREGAYFLRAFDYLENRVNEIEINPSNSFVRIDSPFEIEVPEFNITSKPKSATFEYILKELAATIENAKTKKAYIRIKYKNRNDQLSFRTLKSFKLVVVKEDKFLVQYLIGYCLLRQAERNFRLDRIQSLQELRISYD